MATVENSLQIVDGATPVLQRVNSSINITAGLMRSLHMASSNALALPGMQMWESSLAGIRIQYDRVEETIYQVKEQQDELTKSTKQNKEETEKLTKAWEKVVSVAKNMGINTSVKDIFNQANDMKAAGNVIQTRTGMQGPDLKAAEKSASNLYIDNLSPSLDSAAQSLAAVNQLTGQTGSGLGQVTRAGLLMQDTFGYGLTDSIKSAGVLEQQFGTSGAEAFDLIIQGTQAGLNKNGDLLETINQYSARFKSLGLGGDEMFQALINGADNGGISIASLGDAVSEFSKRAVSGGKDSSQGFSALGLDANTMTEAFKGGGETAKQAFKQTMDALNNMEDPVSRNLAGVKLFGDAWGKIGSDGVMALSDLNGSVELTKDHLEELDRMKYNDAASALSSLAKTINVGLAGPIGGVVDFVTKSIHDFTSGLQGDVENISGIFGVIGLVAGEIGNYIAESWSVFQPVILGIIAAMVVYNAVLGVGWLTMIMSAAATAISTVTSWAFTAAIIAQKLATEGLNAALAACPLTWIIILIIMLIALFYAGVAAVNQFAGTSYSATGIICGVFSAALAFIGNILMAMAEMVIGIVEFILNPFIFLANFIANMFRDPLASAVYLFADFGDQILGLIQKVAKALDLITGSNFEATVSVWREDIYGFYDRFAKEHGNGSYKEVIKPLDLDKMMADAGFEWDRFNYDDAYKSGYNGGSNLVTGAKDKYEEFKTLLEQNDPVENAQVPNEDLIKNTGDTAVSTATMADSMDIVDEELKYMRDAAEQEIINRFTLAELKVDVSNNNTIKTVTDIDNVARMLSDVTTEMLVSSAEGMAY
ncbi:MAG: phage tape measure protein [Lacrimispora sp.]|nr:phage tape measure protein [Lacrimispora sp.]